MQKTIITGNLGADPVVKSFENGGKVANFNVGVTKEVTRHRVGWMFPNTQNGLDVSLNQTVFVEQWNNT